MKVFCFSLTVFGLIQTILALPRPDFGINGDVGNSDKVEAGALSLNGEFVLTGQKDITLTAGYTLLATLRTKLIDIGDAIVLKGTAFATQLKTLSTDDTGPYTPAFGLVETKLNELETLFRTGLAADITAIATALGSNAIKLQFDDAFADVLSAIATLKTSLTTLKTDVGKAQKAAGTSSTVSTAIIRKNIPAKSVTDVISNVRTLRANVQLVTFIINSSLENIALADEFVVDIVAVSKQTATEFHDYVSAYQDLLEKEGEKVSQIISDNVGDDVDTRLSASLADLLANSDYTYSGLANTLYILNTKLTTGTAGPRGDIVTSYASYQAAIPTVIEDLNAELSSKLCSTVKKVVLAHVANAPYSDFCFSKFSARAYALLPIVLDNYQFCFENELSRLFDLATIVERIVAQIVFNVEELAANLDVCLDAVGAEYVCFSAIEPYYEALANQSEEHFATIAELVDAETLASSSRLGACIVTTIYPIVVKSIEINDNLDTCMTNGPNALPT
ncbi:hypothetical protein ZHAS_00014411 [Anopheles sinensis]|uniref:Secreted protein n=1 Tax=Anopheles sinensis TaxID=74873 RepID=A0A084W869_ANOSI|nr:hypothetical protein ZHAS_00014411 [Anopheles sinensis]